ncbi:MAG: septal ring lytic transglycosylase RlpA family protein [Candidatus Puniceispirillaceae bacterium]
MIFATAQHAARTLLMMGTCALLLSACGAAELAINLVQKQNREIEKQKIISGETSIKASPRYKVGDPYQVAGVWYYPERNLKYDETGVGSWYGDEFAGRLTANGEIFDPNKVSAAHKTLPMPSVVRVTNLDNGKSLVVRINDRGPFVSGRIIDLSREAARLIGYKDSGIARVRVQVLTEQSLKLERLAKQGQFPESDFQEAVPESTAVSKPDVKLTARTTRAQPVKRAPGQSALELLSRNRVGEVIQTSPVTTEIWVQIGAFHSKQNAEAVLARVSEFGQGQVTPTLRNGQTLYRSRLGPVQQVELADKLLADVLKMGFNGARIVVD